MRTHLIENYHTLCASAPCLSRAATLPKATKLELGRGAHLKTPSSANHNAAASQPTGRITKAASWLHLSRVSPALHPPERPSYTYTPNPGNGGRGYEIESGMLSDQTSNVWSVFERTTALFVVVQLSYIWHAAHIRRTCEHGKLCATPCDLPRVACMTSKFVCHHCFFFFFPGESFESFAFWRAQPAFHFPPNLFVFCRSFGSENLCKAALLFVVCPLLVS